MAISHRHKTRAFTLIEMLIAIAIIGVLIGLLIPAIHKVRIASQGAATSAQMTAIATAIQAYYGDFKAYPGPLPNSQVGSHYYPLQPVPFALDASGAQVQLTAVINGAPGPFPNASANGSDSQTLHITGAENLVLGLLGGLEITTSGATIVFDYNTRRIFPDDVNPAPLGAMSLNVNRPKAWGAYLQVRPGDLSANGTEFTDAAGRMASDSIIPEFVDKFSQPMPILYLRTSPAGTAVVAYGGNDDLGNPLNAQYDLAQILDYVTTMIGTTSGDLHRDHHGLQKIGNPGDPPNPITAGFNGDNGLSPGSMPAHPPGFNALAYFRVPSGFNAANPANSMPNVLPIPNPNNLPAPAARQQDGFLLISPGPDGVYGTADDIIYPGTLNP
jgi:prepilin-type N-terminal cleavage/methylation domain-containing protein